MSYHGANQKSSKSDSMKSQMAEVIAYLSSLSDQEMGEFVKKMDNKTLKTSRNVCEKIVKLVNQRDWLEELFHSENGIKVNYGPRFNLESDESLSFDNEQNPKGQKNEEEKKFDANLMNVERQMANLNAQPIAISTSFTSVPEVHGYLKKQLIRDPKKEFSLRLGQQPDHIFLQILEKMSAKTFLKSQLVCKKIGQLSGCIRKRPFAPLKLFIESVAYNNFNREFKLLKFKIISNQRENILKYIIINSMDAFNKCKAIISTLHLIQFEEIYLRQIGPSPAFKPSISRLGSYHLQYHQIFPLLFKGTKLYAKSIKMHGEKFVLDAIRTEELIFLRTIDVQRIGECLAYPSIKSASKLAISIKGEKTANLPEFTFSNFKKNEEVLIRTACFVPEIKLVPFLNNLKMAATSNLRKMKLIGVKAQDSPQNAVGFKCLFICQVLSYHRKLFVAFKGKQCISVLIEKCIHSVKLIEDVQTVEIIVHESKNELYYYAVGMIFADRNGVKYITARDCSAFVYGCWEKMKQIMSDFVGKVISTQNIQSGYYY